MRRKGAALPPMSRAWRVAIPILLSFLAFEAFLWLLVFRFNDNANAATATTTAGGERAVVPNDVAVAKIAASVPPTVEISTARGGEVDDVAGSDPTGASGGGGADDGAYGEEEEGGPTTTTTRDEEDSESPAVDGEPAAREGGDSDPHVAIVEGGDDDADTSARQVEGGAVEELAGEPVEEEPVAEEPAEEPQDETGAEDIGELETLRSKLDEGFALLRASADYEPDVEAARRSVESLCGDVWSVSSRMLSSESLDGDDDDDGSVESADVTLDEISRTETSPWKSLALDAQRCLGGAGLAFLSEDADFARLRVSTKVFYRLSYVEPHDPDVRAGLGTSLLIRGIFNDEDGVAGGDDGQSSLLTLATYHLKMASFLCSGSRGKSMDESGDAAAYDDDVGTNLEDGTSASNAAVLHNLALAYIALNDGWNSVPILLRAAALRRGLPRPDNATAPYWNVPHGVLRAAEERALLIAAKTKRPERAKEERRVPFFR